MYFMSAAEYDSWEDMPVTMQIQAIQANVQEIGIIDTLKQAATGELDVENLVTPGGAQELEEEK